MTDGLFIAPLGTQWRTYDPFLFCAFHHDKFPVGKPNLGPDPQLLQGRRIGEDFGGKDGWNMYHGDSIPGFPMHPHRGFETVTIAQRGLVDHSDSMGASGRFGRGDVQWMTAGKGVQHSEMFPLLNQESDNELLLFQIWLNLPARSKMVQPYYGMMWHEDIPQVEVQSKENAGTRVRLIAGEYQDKKAIAHAPDSWAANKDNHIAIWLLGMDPEAEFTFEAVPAGVNRCLYYYEGGGLSIGDQGVGAMHSMRM
ncbi:MAG: pirin family protein, partial [Bacteroidota bacterium]|nr:pirin family protein [Bacteroidota bacterium]MDX5429813.1 pirin family protein [Bacteroidota bacterium]MDX5468592.1 pirin family protein [Bacteroidota bacterium]